MTSIGVGDEPITFAEERDALSGVGVDFVVFLRDFLACTSWMLGIPSAAPFFVDTLFFKVDEETSVAISSGMSVAGTAFFGRPLFLICTPSDILLMQVNLVVFGKCVANYTTRGRVKIPMRGTLLDTKSHAEGS